MAEVAALEAAERAAVINKRAAIWGELKPGLAALSHGKCWYCESRNERADNAVDHFRPKNSVKGSARFPVAPGTPGYWWLAFNPQNYRFSCTFCNSVRHSTAATVGGKQDLFPLWEEGAGIAWRRTTATWTCVCGWPMMPWIWSYRSCWTRLTWPIPAPFGSTITVAWFPDPKKPGEPNESYECCKARAEESIVCYHLMHPDITEARLLVAKEVRRFAREADKWLDRWEQGVPGARAELNCKMNLLKKRLNPDSEYSAAAHCVLRGMRGSSRVAEVLLEQP